MKWNEEQVTKLQWQEWCVKAYSQNEWSKSDQQKVGRISTWGKAPSKRGCRAIENLYTSHLIMKWKNQTPTNVDHMLKIISWIWRLNNKHLYWYKREIYELNELIPQEELPKRINQLNIQRFSVKIEKDFFEWKLAQPEEVRRGYQESTKLWSK